MIYKEILITEIKINRDERQRKDLKGIENLAQSIRVSGLINPITITKDNLLIAGERRLTACKQLCWTTIPTIYLEDLSDAQCMLIEFEENCKRADLPWQEQIGAVAKLHDLYCDLNSTWTIAKTAEALCMQDKTCRIYLDVNKELEAGNTRVDAASSISAAANVVERDRRRAVDNELNYMVESLFDNTQEIKKERAKRKGEEYKPEEIRPFKAAEFKCQDFKEYVATFDQPKFNFLHCDFPYGINHGNSAQGGSALYGAYEDGEDIYWELCSTLCKNLDKLLYSSSHIIFWFSMKHYIKTLDYFTRNAPSLSINPIPLIWHKSDNKGIVSDVTRAPRNIYETAFLMSRGDRRIIQPVANVHSAPTNKANAIHVSEKPEPVLTHFFRMVVDHQTEMLDPTCGGGSAIRSSFSHGAQRMIGLDIEQEYITAAEKALRTKINLDKLHKQMHNFPGDKNVKS